MTFQPGAALYSQAFGTVPAGVNFPIYVTAAPTSTFTQGPFGVLQPGQIAIWQNNASYQLLGFTSSGGTLSANWIELASSSGDVLSVTGTANQILATPTTGNVVLSFIGPYTPATYTAHGVLVGEGTSSIVATAAGTTGQVLTATTSADPAFAALGTNSGLTAHGVVIAENTGAFAATAAGSATQVLQSGGASADPVWSTATYPATATAGSLIAATATNVIGQIADVAVGQALMSGGVGVIPAYTGSPSFSGSVTAATTITATAGNITATSGNFVSSAVGNGIVLNSAATSGTTTATLNGRSGQVTITTPTINAGATFTMTIANTSITGSSTQVLYGLTGGTTGSAITIQSVTNSANQSAVVVQNASAVTNSTASLVLTFLVLN